MQELPADHAAAGAHANQVSVVDGQFGAPTSGDVVAAAIEFADRLTHRAPDDVYGVFHLSASRETTWCRFAKAIFAEAARLGEPAPASIRFTTVEYPALARARG